MVTYYTFHFKYAVPRSMYSLFQPFNEVQHQSAPGNDYKRDMIYIKVNITFTELSTSQEKYLPEFGGTRSAARLCSMIFAYPSLAVALGHQISTNRFRKAGDSYGKYNYMCNFFYKQFSNYWSNISTFYESLS